MSWGIANNNIVVVSGGTPKGLSHTYTCIHPSPDAPHPGCHITLSRVSSLYSRSLLVICFKYSSVYMSIPNSLTIPFPHWRCLFEWSFCQRTRDGIGGCVELIPETRKPIWEPWQRSRWAMRKVWVRLGHCNEELTKKKKKFRRYDRAIDALTEGVKPDVSGRDNLEMEIVVRLEACPRVWPSWGFCNADLKTAV